jgi:hypothetical protein
MTDDLLSMRFDQYQRYRLVADLLERVRSEGTGLRILDVGGRTALLRRFLPDEVTLLDMEPSGEPGLVLGSGSHMPFGDGCFDVVAAFDTLEHVPGEHRVAFVEECVRVASRYVVLAGPYEHPQVVEAEQLLQRFLDEHMGVSVRHLDEHRHLGLPDRAWVEERLRAHGAEVLSLPHGNLERWLLLQCIGFQLDWDESLHGLAGSLYRLYNRELYACDHAEPVYRHVVVAALGEAPLPEVDGLLGPPAQGADVALADLLQLDPARRSWRGEREDLLREREWLLGERSSRDGKILDLEHQLQDTRSALQSLRTEYERAVEALRRMQASPPDEGSRWQSLKRALGPRRTT